MQLFPAAMLTLRINFSEITNAFTLISVRLAISTTLFHFEIKIRVLA